MRLYPTERRDEDINAIVGGHNGNNNIIITSYRQRSHPRAPPDRFPSTYRPRNNNNNSCGWQQYYTMGALVSLSNWIFGSIRVSPCRVCVRATACGVGKRRSRRWAAGRLQTSFSTFFCARRRPSPRAGVIFFYARPHRRLRRPARHADNYFISVVIADRNTLYTKRIIS